MWPAGHGQLSARSEPRDVTPTSPHCPHISQAGEQPLEASPHTGAGKRSLSPMKEGREEERESQFPQLQDHRSSFPGGRSLHLHTGNSPSLYTHTRTPGGIQAQPPATCWPRVREGSRTGSISGMNCTDHRRPPQCSLSPWGTPTGRNGEREPPFYQHVHTGGSPNWARLKDDVRGTGPEPEVTTRGEGNSQRDQGVSAWLFLNLSPRSVSSLKTAPKARPEVQTTHKVLFWVCPLPLLSGAG